MDHVSADTLEECQSSVQVDHFHEIQAILATHRHEKVFWAHKGKAQRGGDEAGFGALWPEIHIESPELGFSTCGCARRV